MPVSDAAASMMISSQFTVGPWRLDSAGPLPPDRRPRPAINDPAPRLLTGLSQMTKVTPAFPPRPQGRVLYSPETAASILSSKSYEFGVRREPLTLGWSESIS